MSNRDIVVIGASAGGIEPLVEIVRQLPKELAAAVFIVLHRSASHESFLPDILRNAGKLTTDVPADRENIRHGRIYVAPIDRHMLLEREHIRITNGPKENRFRPAIDPLFRSAAHACGPRVIGVILSGALDDGTAGLWWIKDRGGITIVQDPGTALHSSMPQSALNNVAIDHCLAAPEIAKLLAELTIKPVTKTDADPVPDDLDTEVKISLENSSLDSGVTTLGPLSEFTCPECHGALLHVTNGKPLRYRCHTGHAYSRDSLLASLTDSVEDSIWNSIRTMEEQVRYLTELAKRAAAAGEKQLAAAYTKEANAAQHRADLVRQVAKRD